VSEEEKDVKEEETETSDQSKEETAEEEVQEETKEEQNPLLSRVQELSDDNRRLNSLVNQLLATSRGQGNPVEQEHEDADEAEVHPAVKKMLKKQEAKLVQQFRGVVGSIMEDNDKSAILSSSFADAYKKYQSDVEKYREDQASHGKYLTREEALGTVLLRTGGFVKKEEAKPLKKVVKQDIKPVGETGSAGKPSGREPKPKTAEEKLSGIKF